MEERAEGGVIAMYNFIAIYRILSYLEQALDYDEPDMSQISSSALGLSANR